MLDSAKFSVLFAAIEQPNDYPSDYQLAATFFALLIIALLFNFVIKRLLKHYQDKFAQQQRIWLESFFQALYYPLWAYVWLATFIIIAYIFSAYLYPLISVSVKNTLLVISAVIVAAWFFLRWKKLAIHNFSEKSKKREIPFAPGKVAAFDKGLTILIFFLSALIILEIANININTIIAFGGIGGLAIAFASQEIIANYFGGFMLHITQPFSVGDWIQIPEKSVEGIVEEIGWYMTRVNALDKRPIYIPNSVFSKLMVYTPARMGNRQIRATLSVRYADIKTVKAIMTETEEILKEHPGIDHSQAIIVKLDKFAEYSIDIFLVAYANTLDFIKFMTTKEDVLFKIADIVAKHGAEFAFPTQEIKLQK